MVKMNNLNEIAEELKKRDNITILTHQYPDGDTLGSAFALCRALRSIGKRSNVIVNGELAGKFEYLRRGMQEQNFQTAFVVAVDIASAVLLGNLKEKYENCVDICIDHHAMNIPFARITYVDSKSAANTENIYQLIKILGITPDVDMANCIYTGLCTDTGCFKFSNVTSRTLRMAAELMDLGCESAEINRVMFDTKSMARINIERCAMNNLMMYCDNKIAVINTTLQMERETGAKDADMDGIAAIPRQIEGVLIGITIKEKSEGHYKISVRTVDGYNAAEICSRFGGGGHHAAAGCAIDGTLDEVREQIVAASARLLAASHM